MKTHITKIALLLLLALGQIACTVNLPGSFFAGPFEKQMVLLRSAVIENNYAAAERYIATGVNINALNESGFTPLHVSAIFGSDKVAAAFLANGANVDAKDEDNYTPLMMASLMNANKVVALFLSHGADVNSQDIDGNTPLLYAVLSALISDYEILDAVLKELRASGLYINKDKITERLSTAEKTVALLLTHGADVNVKDIYDVTPLHIAALSGSDKVAAAFLANGANVDAKDENNSTPLMMASLMNANKVVALLLAHGADVNSQSIDGNTPLLYAVLSALISDHEILDTFFKELRASGLYINKDKITERFSTVEKTVALLLTHGADVNAKITGTKSEDADLSGYTPLHFAALSNNAKMVTMLIEHGAEVNAETDGGYTPLAMVIEEDAQQVVKILRAHGAK